MKDKEEKSISAIENGDVGVGAAVGAAEGKTSADAETGSSAPAAESGANHDKNGMSVGKFRNPEELLKAYGELEREFTRRSQRLAEAERRLAAVSMPHEPTEEEWKEAVDKFFRDTPAAKPFAKDMAKEIMRHPSLKEDGNCLHNALVRVLAAKFRTPEQLMSDGQFLNDYVLTSTAVKAAVVDGYLKGLRAGQPPVVMRDGGQFGVAPRIVPKSIEEAGGLFLKETE